MKNHIINSPIAVAQTQHHRAHLQQLLSRELCHVPRPGHQAPLLLQRHPLVLHVAVGDVDQPVPRRLGPQVAAAPAQSLPRDGAMKRVCEAFVVPVHVADFARAHADVARRHVFVWPDVLVQLHHERLTELVDLAFRLSFGVEVRPAFGTSDRKTG